MNTGHTYRSSLTTTVVLTCIYININTVYATEIFNPGFISPDIANVADLKRFAAGGYQPEGMYKVDIYVNNEYISTKEIDFSKKNNESSSIENNSGLAPCLTKNSLGLLNLNDKLLPSLTEIPASECLSLAELIPDASVKFNFEQQRLYFSIPQASLLNISRGYVPETEWDEGISSFLLDYNFVGSNNQNTISNSSGNSNSYFLRFNSGLNFGSWRLRNESSYIYNQNDNNTYKDFTNISTYLETGINTLKSTLTIGDSYTSGDIFDSFGTRGVQLSSNDEMLPESQRGFAPTINGVANSNAKVILKQNGNVIYETYVAPGPFSISDLYQTLSSGDIHVSIEENNGTTSNFIVPYSAVPILQREGQLKYNITAGKFRSGNDNQTEPNFLQSTAILGLKGGLGLTVYGGTQLSKDYKSFLLGAGMNLGNWGAVSGDITHADTTLTNNNRHKGQSLRFLYAKSLVDFGTRLQLLGYRYSTKEFYTFNESTYSRADQLNNENPIDNIEYPFFGGGDLNHTKKGRVQLSISQNVNKLGSLYISGNRQSYWNTDKTTESLQLGFNWSRNFANYSLAYSLFKTPFLDKTDQSFAFSVSVPLERLFKKPNRSSPYTLSGNTAYATYGITSNNKGETNNQVGLTGTLLENNNLSYNVSRGFNNKKSDSSSVGVNWQTGYGRLNAAYNYTENNRQLNYGVSGGLIVHKDGVTLGQSLGKTNILIKAPIAKHVTIDNTTGITTDWRGYAILPYAAPYRRNRVALDTASLGNNVEIDESVKSVVPTQGATVLANYTVRIGIRALFKLFKSDGSPVPFGSIVKVMSEHGDNSSFIVGDNGQVYLPGLALKGTLNIVWGSLPNEQCQISYELPPESENLSIVNTTLECR